MHVRDRVLHISSPALEYWENELASKDGATKDIYLTNFNKFLEFTGKTADELLKQRQENQTNPDRKIQRQMESQLIKFIAAKREEGKSSATLQIYFASIRSFFEIHYYPLIMRRGDYPKGESLGVRVATKQAIFRAVENKANRNKAAIKAIILFLKDSGLRISDARLLSYGDIAEGLERGDSVIPLTVVTQKQRTVAKTFIGEEAIRAIKLYIEARRKGSPTIPPENVTDKSPLFRTWTTGKIRRLQRESFSSLVRQAFLRVNEANISPHSLRKYVQTNLEAGNVNANWIDQILGHKLINSRDAYSKPTDEQLKEAYTKAYKFLRVYPDITAKQEETSKPLTVQVKTDQSETEETTGEEFDVKTATNLDEATELMKHGFTYAMTINGTMVFKKAK
jgi:integrase